MEKALETVSTIYGYNPMGWDAALGATILAVGFYKMRQWYLMPTMYDIIGAFDIRPRLRGRAMRRSRWEYVQRQAIDAFVEHVEKMVYDGTYTRKEATELYRNAKKCWPVKDLFPSPMWLKEQIRRRLANQAHNPAPLPDATPKKKKLMFKSEPPGLVT